MFKKYNINKLCVMNFNKEIIVRIFNRMNQKTTSLKLTSEPSSPFNTVGIIGAGLMGQSIAKIHLENGISVFLADKNLEVLSSAVKNLSEYVSDKNRLHPIHQQEEWNGFRKCNLVIEAVPEEYKIKSNVLKNIGPHLQESAILATNTSSIALQRLVKNVEQPEKFAAFHFCHPIEERELIEVVALEKTDPDRIQKLIDHAHFLKKRPLNVGNSPGFVVNRLLAFYMNETMELVLDGVEFDLLEQAASEFGMPMGPLSQLDSLGIDIGVRVGQNLFWTYPSRMIPSELLVRMYKAGLLGKKTGEGFFKYNEQGINIGRSEKTDKLIIERLRPKKEYSLEEIQNRLFLPWVVEASILLEENIICDSEQIDEALFHGLGFSHSAGGILKWADGIGMDEIVRRLRNLESLGERYQPTNYILKLAEANQLFQSNFQSNAA